MNKLKPREQYFSKIIQLVNDRTAFQNQSQENLPMFSHICFTGILVLHKFLQIILEILKQSGILPIDWNLGTIWQLPFLLYAGPLGLPIAMPRLFLKSRRCEGTCFVHHICHSQCLPNTVLSLPWASVLQRRHWGLNASRASAAAKRCSDLSC